MWQGIEIEYAIAYGGSEMASPAVELLRAAQALVLADGQPAFLAGRTRTTDFLRNGGRAYVDRLPAADVFEISTAECPDALMAIAHECAADRLVRAAADKLAHDDLQVYKIAEAAGSARATTRGLHESYLVPAEQFDRVCGSLIPFLVIRQLLIGAGGYHEGAFVRSPRQYFVNGVRSDATPRDRPLVSLDKPAHSPPGFRRLHVTNGEGTRSQVAMFLRQALTSMVVADILAGGLPPVPPLADPLATLRELSASVRGPWPIALARGDEVEATAYLEQHYLERLTSHTDAEALALTIAAEVLAALRQDRLESLSRSLEWAIKYDIIERNLTTYFETGCDGPAERVTAHHQYCAITDDTYAELEDELGVRRILDESDIADALLRPPPNSRGALRAELASACASSLDEISWTSVVTGEKRVAFPELDGWDDATRARFRQRHAGVS